jgi:sigma-B regulation protein RsbU (phosphoserine phosphatase)
MAEQGEKCFTAWYGVYAPRTRTLRWAGGGHPPALLLTGPDPAGAAMKELDSTGPVIGTFDDMDYATDSVTVGTHGTLFLYSDGVNEIEMPDRSTWPFRQFLAFMAEAGREGPAAMDRLMAHTLSLSTRDNWEDDFSIVTLQFD